MHKRKALLFSNGSFDQESVGVYETVIGERLSSDDFIISVDGGARHLEKVGLYPDVMLGDFDSISDKEAYFKKFNRASIVELECEKDNTDTDIAIQLAIREGCGSVVIFGGTGSRLDHTLSNIFLMFDRHGKDIDINVVDSNNVLLCIDDVKSAVSINRNEGYYVSVIPITPVIYGVTTHGMRYELSEHDIQFGSTFGISNEVVSERASISLRSGKALVIVSKD